MQKDLQSYHVHDLEYKNTSINNINIVADLYKKYDEQKQFEHTGFARSIECTKNLPSTHIDIGCGGGWLLRKTAPLFKKVIGIEPSVEGIGYARDLLSTQFPNIEFINEEMISGFKKTHCNEAVYITSSVVFSHIEDSYVSLFLQELSHVSNGSVLFFDERYGKNIHKNLWHIRSKSWWAKQLSDWQLEFFELKNSGYKSGIYGIKIGAENVKNTFEMSALGKLAWSIHGLFYTYTYKLKSKMKSLLMC